MESALSTVPVFQYGPPVNLSPQVISAICFGFSQPPLGKGGFSTVFAGVYENRPVAVKVLAIRNAGEHALFQAELGILLNSNLRHPHLLPLIAYCHERPALVMPQLKPLNRERLPRLPGSIRMKVAMDVANGLAHLHDAGFVHNDMKPDNVLLEFDENRRLIRALVGDLGCVKSVQIPVVPFGTILFMDPGLNTSGPPQFPKPADDVYSFGLTIVCIFTNAFPESQEHLRQMWAAVDSGFPLISALARCMTNANPALRPSCRQVARELAVIDNGWRESIERNRVEVTGPQSPRSMHPPVSVPVQAGSMHPPLLMQPSPMPMHSPHVGAVQQQGIQPQPGMVPPSMAQRSIPMQQPPAQQQAMMAPAPVPSPLPPSQVQQNQSRGLAPVQPAVYHPATQQPQHLSHREV